MAPSRARATAAAFSDAWAFTPSTRHDLILIVSSLASAAVDADLGETFTLDLEVRDGSVLGCIEDGAHWDEAPTQGSIDMRIVETIADELDVTIGPSHTKVNFELRSPWTDR